LINGAVAVRAAARALDRIYVFNDDTRVLVNAAA
jgi:hypothetical protein